MNNEFVVPGAAPFNYFLRNYDYTSMTSDLPVLSIMLVNELKRLFYSNYLGEKFKVMVDASTSGNLADGLLMVTQDGGKAGVSEFTTDIFEAVADGTRIGFEDMEGLILSEPDGSGMITLSAKAGFSNNRWLWYGPNTREEVTLPIAAYHDGREGDYYVIFHDAGLDVIYGKPAVENFAHDLPCGVGYYNEADELSVVISPMFSESSAMSATERVRQWLQNGGSWERDGGGALTDIVVNSSGNLDSDCQYAIENARWQVFERRVNSSGFGVKPAQIPVSYTNADGNFRTLVEDDFPFAKVGTAIAYNLNGVLTAVPNDKYVLYTDFAIEDYISSLGYNVGIAFVVPGKTYYNSLTEARQAAETELGRVDTGAEAGNVAIPLGTKIFHYKTSHSNTYHTRIVSTLLGEDYVDLRSGGNGGGSSSDSSQQDFDQTLIYGARAARFAYMDKTGDEILTEAVTDKSVVINADALEKVSWKTVYEGTPDASGSVVLRTSSNQDYIGQGEIIDDGNYSFSARVKISEFTSSGDLLAYSETEVMGVKSSAFNDNTPSVHIIGLGGKVPFTGGNNWLSYGSNADGFFLLMSQGNPANTRKVEVFGLKNIWAVDLPYSGVDESKVIFTTNADDGRVTQNNRSINSSLSGAVTTDTLAYQLDPNFPKRLIANEALLSRIDRTAGCTYFAGMTGDTQSTVMFKVWETPTSYIIEGRLKITGGQVSIPNQSVLVVLPVEVVFTTNTIIHCLGAGLNSSGESLAYAGNNNIRLETGAFSGVDSLYITGTILK